MTTPRPQELTIENKVIDVVETGIVDFIQVNSGTCTGNFSINTISSNNIENTGSTSTDHIVANSGTLSGKIISNRMECNSLTVSGLPVRIDNLGASSGITSLIQDTSPVLGGNLNGNSKNISSLNSITANSGSFIVSASTALLSANNSSVVFNSSADHFIGNSGTLSGKFIADTNSANIGTFNTSLTVSGLPVVINKDSMRLTFTIADGTTWLNMPAAATIFKGTVGIIQQADLTGKTKVKFSHTKGATAGAANARLFLRYSPTFSSSATAYTGMSAVGTFGTPNVQVNNANVFVETGWEEIIPAARGLVYLAVVGSGGDGALDPIFGTTIAEFK